MALAQTSRSNTQVQEVSHLQQDDDKSRPSFSRLAQSWRAYMQPDNINYGDNITESIPPEVGRFITMTTIGAMWGFALGSVLGARRAGTQYLAENVHRLPVTVQGWYFYHKTKNYRVLLGGLQKGGVYAWRLGSLVALFSALEITVDLVRHTEDMWSSAIAGVVSSSIFAYTAKLPPASRKYTIAMGSLGGLAIGGVQQTVSDYLQRPVKYFVRGPSPIVQPIIEDLAINSSHNAQVKTQPIKVAKTERDVIDL